MGIIRFRVIPPDRVEPEQAVRAFFSGRDRFHWQSRTHITTEGLSVERTVSDSGYFRLDRLPKNTAYGYIEEDGSWRTNQYAIPVRGGADGGAFVTAGDMAKFWNRLMDGSLLSEEMKNHLLTVQAQEGEQAYGYGVWIDKQEAEMVKYHVMGYDPGVNFCSGYYPQQKSIVTVLSNAGEGAYDIVKAIEREKKLRG